MLFPASPRSHPSADTFSSIKSTSIPTGSEPTTCRSATSWRQRRSNQNVGGNVLESNGTWSIVRGVGLVESVDDIAQTVVGASGGVPIYVNQVGEVRIGDAFRVSSLVKGTDEAVGGVIVARTGANAQQVIDGVKARIQQISPGLPEGVTIVPFYDRSTLIEQAVDTRRRCSRKSRSSPSRTSCS